MADKKNEKLSGVENAQLIKITKTVKAFCTDDTLSEKDLEKYAKDLHQNLQKKPFLQQLDITTAVKIALEKDKLR